MRVDNEREMRNMCSGTESMQLIKFYVKISRMFNFVQKFIDVTQHNCRLGDTCASAIAQGKSSKSMRHISVNRRERNVTVTGFDE